MARKRKAVDESITAKIDSTPRTRKRFVGVRQRPSGRWVAEIKDTIQKIRVWLGTFDTAEEAARAYDEAACLLRGANTRTNFWSSSNSSPLPPALPSKITNLLLSRLQARNNTSMVKNVSSPSCRDEYEYVDKSLLPQESNFPDYLIHDDSLESISNFIGDPQTCLDQDQPNTLDLSQESDDNNEGFDSLGMEDVDFRFIDKIGCSLVEYSPFEITEEISKRMHSEEEPMTMMSEVMKRMSYERKNSASLYAFNGISEYLNLKMKKSDRSDHLSRLSDLCKSKQEEMMKRDNEEREESPDLDADFSLWNSVDLPPICFVN